MTMLEAIGKPMACCSEEEMEEADKEEEKHEQINEERHRQDERVEEKERKVYKVLGRLTTQGKCYQQPRKAKTKVTIFSILTEGEAEDLAKGFGMALAKHVPKEKLLTGTPEEDIPATLRSIERMKMNLQNLGPESDLDLANHCFGPTTANVFLSFLGDCMK
ncbi:hypothetical protein QQF64_017397 [Cirrhinus molitorella]|uniref:Uncharacterized protein n=1 Tax=Cirrhinus molitorella TaxID=172907 RepID=A0ABR3LLV9_9TELE